MERFSKWRRLSAQFDWGVLPPLLILVSISYLSNSAHASEGFASFLLLLVCLITLVLQDRFTAIAYAAPVFWAWLYCFLCSESNAIVILWEYSIPTGSLFLILALLFSVASMKRIPMPRGILTIQIGLTLFLCVVSFPVAAAEGSLNYAPWALWAYAICFFQIIIPFRRCLSSSPGRRILLLYTAGMICILVKRLIGWV